jgi:hypothetical protein
VLAADPVAGDACPAHRAEAAAARRAASAAQATAERILDAEHAGQHPLPGLAEAGAAPARPAPPGQRGDTPGRRPAAGRPGPPQPLDGTGMPVETTRAGQVRLAVPGLPRRRYATGQQEPCVRCAAAGQARLGVSRTGPGSPALCMSCWRGERDRQARAERREFAAHLWDGIGEAEEAAACAACGAPDPTPDCWLCSYAWLREMRERFELDQQDAAAAEAAESDRVAARDEAEDRVADVTAWVERLRATLTGYADGRGRGRAVELLADLLARLAAARTSARGRPSVTPYVGGVLAVDSNWQSGRTALPGRERTAWLIGCSDRAVYNAFRHVVAAGWAVRTRRGGRNSLERRVATGRANDRAEFDLVPLHRSMVDAATRAGFVPAALALVGELLEHALAVLEREQSTLDELRVRTDTWTDWPELVRRAKLRQAAAQVRDEIAAWDPVNTCRTHTVPRGEYLSSGLYWGFYSPPLDKIISNSSPARSTSDRRKDGASRSPTKSGAGDLESCRSPRLQHPRTPYRGRPRSHPSGRRRRPPVWASWAYPLARDLRRLWPWLAGVELTWIAATVGALLGPDWSAAALVGWVAKRRVGRELLDEPILPVAYLRAVVTEALVGAGVEPPHEARCVVEARREKARVLAAAGRAESADRAAEYAARASAAVPGNRNPEVRALRQRWAAPQPPETVGAGEAWPQVRQPGTGLPPEWDGAR